MLAATDLVSECHILGIMQDTDFQVNFLKRTSFIIMHLRNFVAW